MVCFLISYSKVICYNVLKNGKFPSAITLKNSWQLQCPSNKFLHSYFVPNKDQILLCVWEGNPKQVNFSAHVWPTEPDEDLQSESD